MYVGDKGSRGTRNYKKTGRRDFSEHTKALIRQIEVHYILYKGTAGIEIEIFVNKHSL